MVILQPFMSPHHLLTELAASSDLDHRHLSQLNDLTGRSLCEGGDEDSGTMISVTKDQQIGDSLMVMMIQWNVQCPMECAQLWIVMGFYKKNYS